MLDIFQREPGHSEAFPSRAGETSQVCIIIIISSMTISYDGVIIIRQFFI